MTIMSGSANSDLSQTSNSSPVSIDSLGKDYDKIVQWASGQYERIRNDRRKQESQWYLNLAFYYGKQNVAFTPNSNSAFGSKLIVPKAPYWRSRPVFNKIRPMIRTELAKVTAQKPSAYVIPASSDDDDLMAAQAGEQIWESLYRRKKVKNVLRRASLWTLICGTGFIKSYWDSSAIDPDSGLPGDIEFIPVTPFHLLVPDFMEEEIEDQSFIIHVSTRPVEWVQMNYQKALNGKQIQPSTTGSSEILDSAFIKLIGNNENNNSVLCMEVWVKPGAMRMFPNGVMITLVDNEIIQMVEGWPYTHSQYPFSRLSHIPTGNFYAESTITDLVPLQREYNRTHGQLIESKNRMAKPQLIAPRGSVDASQITSEPGLVIQYTPGFTPPQPLPLQAIPAYVQQELDRIQIDMDDISGQHEVSKGSVPPGVSAATAISYLQEQDDSKLSHTIESIEDGMEKLAQQALSYAIQFWDIPRTIKVTGADQSFDAMMFAGSDLKGNTDIRIEAGSALPTSKSAKQAFIMDLMKMGFVDPQKGLEVMEIGGVQRLQDQLQADTRQAQRENLRMQKADPMMLQQAQMQQQVAADGTPVEPPPMVPVNTWDNHQVHVEIHNNFRKSQSYEVLTPEVQALFEQHVQMHQMAMVAANMGQLPMLPGMEDVMLDQEQGLDPGAPPVDNSTSQPPPQGA